MEQEASGNAEPSSNELRSEINSLVSKLEHDLWQSISRWQTTTNVIDQKRSNWTAPPRQLPPLKHQASQLGQCQEVLSRLPQPPQPQLPPAVEERVATPQLRVAAAEDNGPVQVTDVESPMSQLVPRVLDLSGTSEPQGNHAGRSLVSETQSEGGVLRASYFGALDFSDTQSPSPIGTVQSSAKKDSSRMRLSSAWSGTSARKFSKDADAVGLLDTALELPDEVKAWQSADLNEVVSSPTPNPSPDLAKLPTTHVSPGDPASKKGRLANIATDATVNKKRKSTREYSPLAKQRAEQMRLSQNRIERFTKSQAYELCNAVAIVLNALLIIFETEHRSILASESMPADEIEEKMTYATVLGGIFSATFLFDLVLRLTAERKQFFYSRDRLWNIFDCAVVVTSVIETLIHWVLLATATDSDFGSVMGKFSMLRILRLLRVIQAARFVKTSRFFRELRIMVCSLTGAMRTLVWSIVLMVTAIAVFGVFFTDGAVAYRLRHESGPKTEDYLEQEVALRHFFSTLSVATVSLYQAMSGGVDWGDIWTALSPMPSEYRAAFIFFITFSIFALLNVVTAVVVETSIQRSQNDRDLLVQQEMEQKIEFVDSMQRVFEELDADGNGSLTLDEFEAQLDDEHILSFMSTLELDIDQVRTLVTLLDKDGNGSVDIEEFVEGCLKLKGGAKSLDMAILQFQVEYILANLTSLSKALLPPAAQAMASPLVFVKSAV